MGEGVPLHGDRAVWNDIDFPTEHAKDISLGTPLFHLPIGGTKGAIAVFDGEKWSLLSIGSNDQVLKVSSDESTGLKWLSGGGGILHAVEYVENPSTLVTPTLSRTYFGAYASSSNGGAPSAIDSSSTSCWDSESSQTTGMYWGVNMDAAYQIAKITVLENHPTDWPNQIVLKASATGVWGGEEVVVGTYAQVQGSNAMTFTPATYRYWRLYAASVKSGLWWKIYDVVFFALSGITIANIPYGFTVRTLDSTNSVLFSVKQITKTVDACILAYSSSIDKIEILDALGVSIVIQPITPSYGDGYVFF